MRRDSNEHNLVIFKLPGWTPATCPGGYRTPLLAASLPGAAGGICDGAGAALAWGGATAPEDGIEVKLECVLIIVWRRCLQALLGAVPGTDAGVAAQADLPSQHDLWVIGLEVVAVWAVSGVG